MMARKNFNHDSDTLPASWKFYKLDKVAQISSGSSAPQGDEYFKGKWPFIRVSHLETDSFTIKDCDYVTDEALEKYKLKKYPKDTIVFPKSGASIRLEKRAIIPEDAYIVNHLCTVNAKPKMADQFFLLYALKHHKFADDKASGYPTLSLTEIKNTSLPFPPSHRDQPHE